MDPRRFDTWTRSVFGTRSRRDAVQLLLRGTAGGVASLLGWTQAAAACAKAGERCVDEPCCGDARCKDNHCVSHCPKRRQCGKDDCCNLCEECVGGLCTALKPTCVECQSPICNPTTGQYECQRKCSFAEVCCKGKCIDSCNHCTSLRDTACPGVNGDECVDVQMDPKNCGTCGNLCKPCETCKDGACVSKCQSGETCCGGQCCPSGRACTDGVCTCPQGYKTCGTICCETAATCCNGACCGSISMCCTPGWASPCCPPTAPCTPAGCEEATQLRTARRGVGAGNLG
jgi:hypothetical protein